jgi:superfamily II DNA or RNA helicase
MLIFKLGNIVTKVDKTSASRQELKALHEVLSVKVPNHWFSSKFKHGQWDGYKRFFNLLTCTLYTGLVWFAIRSLDEAGHNIQCKIVDERTKPIYQNNPLNLNGITLRDYQVKMIEEAVKSERGIISAPPNAGKTEVAAGIIQKLGLPAIFFTHRNTLLHQTRKRFQLRLGKEIGLVGSGIEEWSDITVVSVQTANKRLDTIKHRLAEAHVIISDECHHVQSTTWEKLIKSCTRAHIRLGLSATPLLRDDVSNMIVRGLLGDEIIAITNKELIASGISAYPSVYLLEVHKPKVPSVATFDIAYDDGILNHQTRNNLIVSSAEHFLNQGKSVFILIWRIPHGQILVDLLKQRNIEAEFISGEDKNERVSSVLDSFSRRTLKCVVSSTISDEGLDVPSMDVMLMGVGFKAPLKTIQRVGRGLRSKKEGENIVQIVDFIDWHNKKYLYKHSVDRLREYINMGIQCYAVPENDWSNEPVEL